MGKDATVALRDGMALGHWGVEELWIAMFGLGSLLTSAAIGDIIGGAQDPTEREYGMLRIALNEHLDDLGLASSVVPWTQLPESEPR